MEPAVSQDSIAADMGLAADLTQFVLRKWLEANAYLPVGTIAEDSGRTGTRKLAMIKRPLF
ncbi:hypothetical protein [Mesorhizobium waimense]|uniref:hypothetical protein n=1 Tax=Mesorhizobium waimense TaxID=1300307 RepID=UPI0011C3E094|nr:hypothetical protein [Mesorhizobium waimense]